MNIIYVSLHEILEWDEVKLLSSIPGVKVRSIGAFADPRNNGLLRPNIPESEYSEEFMRWIAHYEHPDYPEEKHVMPRECIEWADVIIYAHAPEHIMKSKDILNEARGPIIYRSIGQSSDSVEILLGNFKSRWKDKFQIIRYSPNEQYHYNYAGSDGLIRFYKDPNEYKNWEGAANNLQTTLLMALQAAPERGSFGHFDEMDKATEGLNRILIGPRNEGLAHKMKTFCPSYEDYKRFLRTTTVLFYGGMIPASYTLTFIEAMLTGMPIISIDKDMWAGEHAHWSNPKVFEAPELIDELCVIHSWDELKPTLSRLIESSSHLKSISHSNRLNAEMLFGKDKIKRQWMKLLGV